MSERKVNKLFWLQIAFGVILILLAIVLCPLWENVEWAPWKSWGKIIVNLIVAGFLSYYLFGFVVKRFGKAHHKTVNVLTVIEFILLLIVDLYLILGQFIPQLNIIPVNNACAVIGLAFYIRGVVEVFRAYYFRINNNSTEQNKEKYPIWWLCISIGFISIGMWFMIKPIFADITIVWIFDVCLLVLGFYCLFYGIFTRPKKEKRADV